MTMSLPKRHAPAAPARKSASQVSDELSVLKANVDDAVDMLHSEDPEEREVGQAMLESLIEHEGDLRAGANRIIGSASKDDVFAAGLNGQIDELLSQVAQLKSQQSRFQRRAQRKRVFAVSLLDHHFSDEKTHPTPWGNIGTLRAKPTAVNKDGSKLRLSDIPDDYEWLISKQEKTTTVKVIDEQKILEGLAKGETFGFARLKENSTRFY